MNFSLKPGAGSEAQAASGFGPAGGKEVVEMVKVKVWAKPLDPQGVEVEIGVDYEGIPHRWVKQVLGANEELGASIVSSSYREFIERYPHLYSNSSGYLAEDDDPKRLFNIDMFADHDSDWIHKVINMVERGLTEQDLQEAFEELLDVVAEIVNRYKNDVEKYHLDHEIVVEKEFL